MGELRSTTDLDTVRAFLNTLDLDAGTDVLEAPEELAAWLADAGLCSAGDPAEPHDLELARSLRAALRHSAAANDDGEPAPAAADELTRLATELDVRLAFSPASEVELASTRSGVEGALGAIVAATTAAMVDGRWRRVKLCRSDECGWAFYDGSRNRSGRWCDMAVCGNREKVRAYRSRHADEDPVSG